MEPVTLTELETVKMENFGLKHNALQQQVNANLAQRAAFIAQMELDHPGTKWEEGKGLMKLGPVEVTKEA